MTMCGSKGSYPISEAAQLAQYQRFARNQPNLYKQEFTPPSPSVEVTARELTKEELRERLTRKLDLEETKLTDPVDILNNGRWRQVMDEVFKDDNKGGNDAKRTPKKVDHE